MYSIDDTLYAIEVPRVENVDDINQGGIVLYIDDIVICSSHLWSGSPSC